MQPRQRNVQKSVMHVQSWLLLAELSREARDAAGHHGLENEVIYPSGKMANG